MKNLNVPSHEYTLSFSRSSGAGGQNVNKVNTKVTLRWNPGASQAIAGDILSRFLTRFAYRISADGELLITSERFRSQKRNSEDCITKLHEMLESVAVAPKKRRPTKPKRSSVEKRLTTKKIQGERKKLRRRDMF